jgi:hypothetical protein
LKDDRGKDSIYGETRTSNYWMTLAKREDAVNGKRKHQIALCGELDLEESVDLS